MQQHLFVLLLFTGVLPLVLSVPRKYHLILENKTWDDARAYCRDVYTDLAAAANDDEMAKVQEEAQAHQFSSGAWIGLYTNINSWTWAFNNEPLGSFTAWKPGFPDNLGGTEMCGYIGERQWFDGPCRWTFPSLCFDDTKTGSDRYILVTERKTWDDAQSYCRQHYTDLASTRDSTENFDVGGLNYWAACWFGLRREPLRCGVADLAPCSDEMPFFCYSIPDRQQIIRLKVSSREDVNDPAVMAAILEKIEHKLKEHGLDGNVTVKWREQPDGLVFHKEEENNML